MKKRTATKAVATKPSFFGTESEKKAKPKQTAYDRAIAPFDLAIPSFLRRTEDDKQPSWVKPVAYAATVPVMPEAIDRADATGLVTDELHPLDPKAIGSAADGTSVRTDTGNQAQNDEQAIEPTEFAYTPAERTAIDQANEAFAPVIESVDTIEDIESWVPPLVRGVRALRDRAMRETGALNYFDQQYRRKFSDLLNAEPIGPWLLDERRRSLLDAVHYLGREDTYLDVFIEWRRTEITEQQRNKWRSLRILVEHFKKWQRGTVPKKDRRTSDQKAIEQVRTEGHKADAARLAEVEQARQELATRTIETTETFWTALRQAGPEKFVQTLKDQDAKEYGRTSYDLLGHWLKETTS
jgi:hypothetical protein